MEYVDHQEVSVYRPRSLPFNIGVIPSYRKRAGRLKARQVLEHHSCLAYTGVSAASSPASPGESLRVGPRHAAQDSPRLPQRQLTPKVKGELAAKDLAHVRKAYATRLGQLKAEDAATHGGNGQAAGVVPNGAA
jgi:hypothetical protein